MSDTIIGPLSTCLRNIKDCRVTLLASLQSTFPALCYVTLGSLAKCAIVVFLIDTDQDVLFFMASHQLRTLFATFVRVITLLAAVVYPIHSESNDE